MFIWLISGVLLAQTSSPSETGQAPTAPMSVITVAKGAELANELGESCLYGAINGGLMLAAAALRAPEAGPFWVACFSTPQSAPRWQRFVVDDVTVPANFKHQIAQDIIPPTVRLNWKPANENEIENLTAQAPSLIGPIFTLDLEIQEQSQVRSTRILVNGIEATLATWSAGLTNTTEAVQFEIESEDVLGNVGKANFGPFKFDAIAPDLAFEVLNSPAGVASGQVGAPPYILALTGSDASGVVQLSAGTCRGEKSMQCTITSTQATLQGIDAVGNSATRDIVLTVDDQKPSFLIDAEPIVGKHQLKRGDSLALSASDDSGIDSAYALFGGSRRELPMNYRAVHTGRYKIYLVARDAFGNQSKQTVSIEVRR